MSQDFYEETVRTYSERIQNVIDKKLNNLSPSRSQHYSTSLAKEALAAINDINKKHGTRIFLNGGGLLGVIREGDMLSHDYDLDVGFIEKEISLDALKEIFELSPDFKLLSVIPEQFIVSYRGMVIDIYAHFDDGDGHLNMITAMHTWRHDAFELKKIPFGGTEIYIPEDPEKYLSECYGDWENKKLMFDFSYDTPNRGYRGVSGLVYLLARLENAIRYGWDSYASMAVSALYRNFHIDYRHIFPMPVVPHPADNTKEQTIVYVVVGGHYTMDLHEDMKSHHDPQKNFVVVLLGDRDTHQQQSKIISRLSFVTQVMSMDKLEQTTIERLFPSCKFINKAEGKQ